MTPTFFLRFVACTFCLFVAASRAEPTKLAEVPQRMQALVDSGEISGAVTLLARHGQVVQLAAVGKADLASGRAMKADDLFWIASMTKPMTAVAVLMLQDEGKLSVEDAVEKHLPEFAKQWQIETKDKDRLTLVRPARPITIRDLLTHTAGLGNVAAPRPDSTLAELCMAYAREPLQFSAGSKWQYDNAGINTLGRIVEVVSGLPFAEFLQQRLFTPLEMKDTTFWPDAEQAARVVTSYKKNEPSGALEATGVFLIQGGLTNRARTPYPAGGLFSTASDVARFYTMMLAGGSLDGRQYLKKETVAELTRTQTGEIKTGFTDGMSWGLGFQVVKEPLGVTATLSPGTFGHGGAYGTQSWGDPKRGAIYILMIQRAGLGNGDASEIRRVFQTSAAAALAD